MPIARSLLAAIGFLLMTWSANAADPDLPIKARAVLRKHCAECHGETQQKGDLSIFDHAGMRRADHPFIQAVAESSELLQLIEDGSMPPGNRPKVTKAETDLIRVWLNASAPAYPKAFDDLYVLNTILADVQKQPAADRPKLRYFSIAELVADDDANVNLASARTALEQGLNRLAKGPLPPLEAADPSATVFRLDLSKTGWDMKPFQRRVLVGTAAKLIPSEVNLYDLVLLEYPHGRLYPNDPAFRQLADSYLKPANQVRPMAFVRGEWFVNEFINSSVAAEIRAALELPEPKLPPPKMPKSLRPPDDPAGSIAMLPLDSVSGANPPQPFSVEFDLYDVKLKRVKARFMPGDEFYFYIQPARAVNIEVNWKDATGKRQLMNFSDQDSVIPAEKDKYIGRDDKKGNVLPYKFGNGVPGKEYLTIFASEKPFPRGELLKTNEHLDERVIHRFYVLPGEKSEFDFDPAKIVKKTIEIETQKKD